MGKLVDVKPLERRHRRYDWFMERFVMPFVAGTLYVPAWGKPQRTHWWHVQRLTKIDYIKLQTYVEHMVFCPADSKAGSRYVWGLRLLPRTHFVWLPGGWRRFVVLEPTSHDDWWHVGWIIGDELFVHRRPVLGPVRMLLGPKPTTFFAICVRSGKPKHLETVGRGRLYNQMSSFGEVPQQ